VAGTDDAIVATSSPMALDYVNTLPGEPAAEAKMDRAGNDLVAVVAGAQPEEDDASNSGNESEDGAAGESDVEGSVDPDSSSATGIPHVENETLGDEKTKEGELVVKHTGYGELADHTAQPTERMETNEETGNADNMKEAPAGEFDVHGGSGAVAVDEHEQVESCELTVPATFTPPLLH
jgi:hypothetical protein